MHKSEHHFLFANISKRKREKNVPTACFGCIRRNSQNLNSQINSILLENFASNELHFNPIKSETDRRFLIVCMESYAIHSVIPIKVVEFRNTRVYKGNLQPHFHWENEARFKCIRYTIHTHDPLYRNTTTPTTINDSVHKFCITFSHHCNSISLNLIWRCFEIEYCAWVRLPYQKLFKWCVFQEYFVHMDACTFVV